MSAVLSRRGSLLAVLAALAFVMAMTVYATSANAQEEELGVCHVPPGNPENAHWIGPDEESFDTHEAHGDEVMTQEECEGTDTTGETSTSTTGTSTTTGTGTSTTGPGNNTTVNVNTTNTT